VDNHPKFLMQAWNLVCSLMETGDWPKPGVDLIIHHTNSVDSRKLVTLERLGAKLVSINPWGTGKAAYCNKIRQLETPEVLSADVALLLDTDVVVAKPLETLVSSSKIRGKIVDYPNPPEDFWRDILSETSFVGRDIFQGKPSMSPESRTPATNFNGGVYVLPHAAVATLKSLWPKWSSFCLDRSDRLGEFGHHADQMGFALAMLEGGLEFELLSLGENFPLHLKPEVYQDIDPCELAIIHYHWQMDNHGLPKPLGIEWIDEQVRSVSKRIEARRRQVFDNTIFWDYRYEAFPELGSGVGSRGHVLAYKRARLAPFFQLFAQKPVLDVGCGDLETTRHAPFSNYTGLDLSECALQHAQAKRPDWSFSNSPLRDIPDRSAALVLCLDVLIHQAGTEDAQTLIHHVVRIATDAVIVSGYQSLPSETGIVFAHLPVIDLLESHPDIERVVEIGRYRGLALVFAVKKSSASANPADIGFEGLAWGLANCPRADLLDNLVSMSRDHFTFFPKTIIRTIEYPWMASRMWNSAGQRILDLGAGVNVLPIWLADRGAEVVTVDYHPIVRDPKDRLFWNEWGFLDFAYFDERITSHHQDMTLFSDEQGFDVIYSISAIEHMPSITRREIIARLPGLLRPEGRLLLTLDLVPGTFELWPLSEGQVVDAPGTHGDLKAIVLELEEAGFKVFEQSIMRDIPGSRTDLVMLDLRLKEGFTKDV
jgi:2-polyprenyl-3-methyl-5-hydroxy-6-metoxy-1,4-benzoquinol methylase